MAGRDGNTVRIRPVEAECMIAPEPSNVPLILGIGGTTRPGSSTEHALKRVLLAAEAKGARTEFLGGEDLLLPLYAPEIAFRSEQANRFVEAIRRCDGLVIASPAYHGTISGLMKNALDYIEDTRLEDRPYLQDRVVGCIACAYGDQAIGTTLVTLRSVAHALRGWPTPFNVGVNSLKCTFDDNGMPSDISVERQFQMLASQVVDFARMMNGSELLASSV